MAALASPTWAPVAEDSLGAGWSARQSFSRVSNNQRVYSNKTYSFRTTRGKRSSKGCGEIPDKPWRGGSVAPEATGMKTHKLLGLAVKLSKLRVTAQDSLEGLGVVEEVLGLDGELFGAGGTSGRLFHWGGGASPSSSKSLKKEPNLLCSSWAGAPVWQKQQQMLQRPCAWEPVMPPR